ncbi:sensor histidine kinase [Actinocorallia longicatena]|uniref:histidine kinase n=1 Tax=Actinocorallia longicatena TaxID=111803 RepID=A0ABP6QJ65_9ACTN
MTPLKLVRDRSVWLGALYLPLSSVLGLAWFVGLAGGIPLAGALTIIWVGVLLWALLFLALRYCSILDRRVIEFVYRVKLGDPYRRTAARGLLGRARVILTDPATWKDLAFQVIRIPLSFGYFVVAAVGWSFCVMSLLMPVIAATGGDAPQVSLGSPTVYYQFDTFWKGLLWMPVGVLGTIVMLYVVKGLGMLHVALSTALLAPSEKQALKAQTAHLKASRARGVDAAEAERRRIERDLHDGAQQQLLAVAMDIGRARSKLSSDPEAARELIEQAHSGARAAIAELRDLARGIYPAILTDRGLSPALSSLAARAPVPVEIIVDVAERPPAVVESIAYFTVAEALTNVAKYAEATEALVRAERTGEQVTVSITDNGRGGARITHGGGLSGLADRAATIDGTLSVVSPPGEGTTITVVLPCSW